MPLLLEVISGHAGGMGANRCHVVRSPTVRIGRDDSCDWVIPDPYVSRHHVTVRLLNGMYFVEGKGRNRVAVNDRSQPVVNDDPHLISDGDVLYVDEYEIRVSVISDADAVQLQAQRETKSVQATEPAVDSRRPIRDPLEVLGGGSKQRTIPESPQPKAPGEELLDRAFKPPPIDLITGSAHQRDEILRDDWYRRPVQHAEISPAAELPSTNPGGELREDWYRSAAEGAILQKTVVAASEQPIAGAKADVLRDILAGAGLDTVHLEMPATVANTLGAVLRIVVEGTMDVLRARSEIKRQFRLPATHIARADNNPLKFSVDAPDALFNLLVKQNSAYLGAEEAFRDGFEDIRLHQMAVLQALQAGFERMLAAFDPERLQEPGESAGALRALAGGKSRSWDRYVEHYGKLSADREDAFRHLFGDAFGAAYEEELRRLKQIRRSATPARREEP